MTIARRNQNLEEWEVHTTSILAINQLYAIVLIGFMIKFHIYQFTIPLIDCVIPNLFTIVTTCNNDAPNSECTGTETESAAQIRQSLRQRKEA